MDKFVIDQAEGLRRLLAREGSRVIAVTGGPGAPGRTTVVINLAAALTAQGKDVLVIDECLGPRSVNAQLGGVRGAGSTAGSFAGNPAGTPAGNVARSLADNFAAVMRGEMALDEAVGRHALGFGVLAAPREPRAPYTRAQMNAQLSKVLAGPADFVLIDAQRDAEGALSPLALHAHDVLIVMRVAAQAITDAYACIKRLHFAHAIGQFRVLANHVASATDAQAALENLADVASRYLTVSLESAGGVAADPHMPRALQLARCIVDAFPSTAAARDFRHVAAELPHWPMRPALAASGDAQAQPANLANPANSADSFVSSVTGVPSAPAPAHAGWRADPPVQRTAHQHA